MSETISGSNGSETIYSASGGTLQATLFGSSISTAISNDYQTVSVDDRATGSTLYLNTGTDVVVDDESAGNTFVAGAHGTSTITGGSGADRYEFVNGSAGGTEVIIGFKSGDELVLSGYGGNGIGFQSVQSGSLVVTLVDGTTITFAGVNQQLSASTVVYETGCFYPGTRIATPEGETNVEDLRTGGMVCTGNGPKPVRWVGQSHIHTGFADKLRVLPIRIAQGALGGGLPARDLLLSPDHAICLDGLLVQAGALVNDGTIRRETDVPEQFTYYHVELDMHELLTAEGVAAESFVDHIDRMNFHNWAARTPLPAPITEMDLPRVKSPRQVPLALRRQLQARGAAG